MTQPLLTYRGTVYPWHCDHVGHMNVMWYVGKFDEATWNLFHHVGLTPSYLREQDRGMAAVEQRLFYLRELRAGAVVTIRSVVNEVREKVIVFTHEMTNDDTGEPAARTVLTGVHMDTARRKACPFEAHVLEAATKLAQAQGAHEPRGGA
ncbi:MAG: acyl-CoA thioesterase [Burkholderiales bacterium]|nr:acyl-CoA thioesterase [Burkholderiales bacterium]GIK86139.1 MAG: thioesterase [Betaproteobacteria bacterium]